MDLATISLVDKEALRVKLAAIYETIKVYYKASVAARVAAANVKAEELAKSALDNNQVGAWAPWFCGRR